MRVYRAIENVFLCRVDNEKQNEYQYYLKSNISKLALEHNHGENMHDYIKNKHYIHFFCFNKW